MPIDRVGVVILHFGNSDDTVTCVDSLARSDDLDVDLVVVDNGPEGAAFMELRDRIGPRGETVASGDNLGYAAGNNIGISRVLDRGCDFVWILNPDTVVEASTLPVLLDHMANVPDCGIVGPRILLPGPSRRIWFDGGLIDWDVGTTLSLNAGLASDLVEPQVRDVDYVAGTSMLARRSTIEDIGLLPEHYFLYFEDTDWCLRAQRAGWRTMVNQRARMVHEKRSSGVLPRPHYLYYMIRNSVLFADFLGVDGESALQALDKRFLKNWRTKVDQHQPSLLPAFDDIVELAKTDGRARVTGRRADITDDLFERVEA